MAPMDLTPIETERLILREIMVLGVGLLCVSRTINCHNSDYTAKTTVILSFYLLYRMNINVYVA